MFMPAKSSFYINTPSIFLNGRRLSFTVKYKYLGTLITHDGSDEANMSRQRFFYARSNGLSKNFNACSSSVKATLFRAFCSNMYCVLTKQPQNKLAAAQTKMERSMLNITYKDRKTNIWVRERTKVIDIINTVRKMKWSWAGHINRLKDDRWTSHVTSWRPYDKKRRQGRPAKRWRDDLDKYWSDTIWQRKAQDRVVWRQHAEAFAQPRDTTAA